MKTSNLKAVPIREFNDMDDTFAWSDSKILLMREELREELEILRGDIRSLGAARNGLAAIEKEMMLRGIG